MKNHVKLSRSILFLLIVTLCTTNYGMEEQPSIAKKLGYAAVAGAVIGAGYLLYKKMSSYFQGNQTEALSDSVQQDQSEALLSAAKENDCVTITKLLDEGIDVNITDANGRTALMWAAYKGNRKAVECLLNNSQIEVNQVDKKNGSTALMFAAETNNCFIINVLLENGADINKATLIGSTALMFAVTGNHIDAVQCLLNNPNIAIINQPTEKGWTPLARAVEKNNCPMIQLLIKYGADVNYAYPEDESTILMGAINENKIDVVQCLLASSNVIIDQQNYEGITALMMGAIVNNCLIIQMVLKYGADINKTDIHGSTALILSAGTGSTDAVRCLLSDPNILIDEQNKVGNTALLLAIKQKNKLIIQQLLDAGADPEFINKKGNTPRNVALNIKLPENYSAAIFVHSFARGVPQRLNLPVKIGSDPEILSLINKAIIKKRGGVNPFIEPKNKYDRDGEKNIFKNRGDEI